MKLRETEFSELREELLNILIRDFKKTNYTYRNYAEKLVGMSYTTLSSLVNRKRHASFDLLLPILSRRGLIDTDTFMYALLGSKLKEKAIKKTSKENKRSNHSQPLTPSLEPKIIPPSNLNKNFPHNAPEPLDDNIDLWMTQNNEVEVNQSLH